MADIDGTTFLTGANAGFIAELYSRFLEDPDAVDESWRRFFSEMGEDASVARAELHAPNWSRPASVVVADRAAGAQVDGESTASRRDRLDPRIESDPCLSRAGSPRSRSRSARFGDARGPTPSSTTRAMASPRPISTARSSSATSSAASAPACARSWRSCARPIAARSASSTCTSRCRPSAPGSRRNSKSGAGRRSPRS